MKSLHFHLHGICPTSAVSTRLPEVTLLHSLQYGTCSLPLALLIGGDLMKRVEETELSR